MKRTTPKWRQLIKLLKFPDNRHVGGFPSLVKKKLFVVLGKSPRSYMIHETFKPINRNFLIRFPAEKKLEICWAVHRNTHMYWDTCGETSTTHSVVSLHRLARTRCVFMARSLGRGWKGRQGSQEGEREEEKVNLRVERDKDEGGWEEKTTTTMMMIHGHERDEVQNIRNYLEF